LQGLKWQKKIAFFLLVFSFSTFNFSFVDPVDTYSKFKALYIYNFPKYFDWPESYKQGNFVIGMLGDNAALITELNKVVASKSVGEQKIEVKSFTSPDVISKCQILIVSASKANLLSKVTAKLKGQSTLIISEGDGTIKAGSVINFVIKNSKQKFELSLNNAGKCNLKVSQNISSLAILVD
jgi:hypothetical protein